jgi:hypothetical protein
VVLKNIGDQNGRSECSISMEMTPSVLAERTRMGRIVGCRNAALNKAIASSNLSRLRSAEKLAIVDNQINY